MFCYSDLQSKLCYPLSWSSSRMPQYDHRTEGKTEKMGVILFCYLELQLHDSVEHWNRARHTHERRWREMLLLLLLLLHGFLKEAAHVLM